MKTSCAGLRKNNISYFLVEKPDKLAIFSKDDYKICEKYFMVGSGILGDFQALLREVRKDVNIHITTFDEVNENYVNNIVFEKLTKNIMDLTKRPLETEVLVSGPENMYYISRESGIVKVKKGYALGPKKEIALGLIDSFDESKNPADELKKIENLWKTSCFIFSAE